MSGCLLIGGTENIRLRQLICRKAVGGSPREKGTAKDLEDGRG